MSIITENYYRGINLGGWLSQCPKDKAHYDSFITEEDIKVIKASGFDHVRIPFDYDLLEQDHAPYAYGAEGLGYIKQALQWCIKHGLNMVLDLHKAPGYSFDTPEENQLFGNDVLQDRMVKLWVFLAKELRDYRECLVFELLNEIVEPDSSRWNKLANLTIAAIRQIDEERYIIVGGNHYNAVSQLKNLELPEDKRLIYNFHFYEPFFVTHQKAGWSTRMVQYNRNLEYPGQYIALEAFLEEYPEQYDAVQHLLKEEINLEAMKSYFMPAITFLKEKQVPLYCGEFGVIALASMATRENWHKDIMDLLGTHHIGGAVWSYKGMDFEIFKDQKPVSQPLLEIITKRE